MRRSPPPAHAASALPGAGTVELAFTPGDAIDTRIVAVIDAAQREVLVQAFSFTQQRLARALIAAHRRGVAVAVVADRAQTLETPHSAVRDLAAAGVPVWLDGNFAAAHNKVLIADAGLPRATTVTGSYNFTVAAQRRNAENVVDLSRQPGRRAGLPRQLPAPAVQGAALVPRRPIAAGLPAGRTHTIE